MRRLSLILSVPLLAFAVAACGSDSGGSSASTPAASSTPATSTPAANACAKDQLDLKTAGKLTIGTDKPAYPPYFEDNDPTNGKGFESAVAYAIADQLGYSADQVKWVVEP